MKSKDLNPLRYSRMELNEVYFWTNTIKNWFELLRSDQFKLIIINQLQWLKNKNKIRIFAYVIMPNHMHIIWEMLELNGKEMPHASFNKWTGSRFLNNLRINQSEQLHLFVEIKPERNHRFWQRDPLAILMDSREKIEQKIDYIHTNPLQEKWNLVTYPEDYRWSSAGFYETGIDEFGILTHYRDYF